MTQDRKESLQHPPTAADSMYWLLWDGDCGFCRRTIAWAKRHDTANQIQALPYQQAPWPPMTDELARRCAKAIHLKTPQGTMLSGGRACIRVLELIGYRRLAHLLSWPPLVWCVELGYKIVARNRRFFSRFLFRSQPL